MRVRLICILVLAGSLVAATPAEASGDAPTTTASSDDGGDLTTSDSDTGPDPGNGCRPHCGATL